MTETEIERLVVRLVGDGSEYVKMLKEAQTASKEAEHAVKENAEHIEGFHRKLEEFAEGVEKSLLRVGLAIGAWEAFEKFDQAERTIRHLGATIEVNGGNVRETTEDYEKFAKTLSKTVLQSKGDILELVQIAETFGLTGDRAKKAAEEAIALGAATGNSAESMLRLAQAMSVGGEEGAIAGEMFKRLVPQLRKAKDETEFLAIYQKLVSTGMKIAAGDAADAGGQLEKLKQQMAGLGKEIGATLAPAIEGGVDLLKEGMHVFNALGSETRTLTVVTLALVASYGPLMSGWGFLVTMGGRLVATINMIGGAILTMSTNAVLASGRFALLRIAILGVAAGAVIYGLVTAQRRLGEIDSRLKAINDQAGKRRESFVEGANKALEGVKDIGGRGTQLAELDRQKKTLDAQVQFNKDRVKAIEELQKEHADRGTAFSRGMENIGESIGLLSPEAANMEKGLNAALEAAQADLAATEVAAKKVAAAKDQLASAGVKAADEYVQKLLEEATMTGKTEEEVMRHKLAVMGLSAEKMEEVATAQEAVRIAREEAKAAADAADKKTKLAESIDQVVQGLLEQTATMGMSADEIQIYKLRLQGADEATIEFIENLQAQKNESDALINGLDDATESASSFRQEVERIDAALSGSAEAMARTTAFRESIKDMFQGKVRGTDGQGLVEGSLRPVAVVSQPTTSTRSSDRTNMLLDRAVTLLGKIEENTETVLIGEDGD